MMAITVQPWKEIAEVRWDSILLGNGASIALHDKFRYGSLLEVARSHKTLGNAEKIFQYLDTSDFEYVLLACWHADIVNSALGSPSCEVRNVYTQVREALIDAVRRTHCSRQDIAHTFKPIADFLSRFRTVVTLNYDLTLYWCIMEANKRLGNWFKDGFVGPNHTFASDWERLRENYQADGSTLVFYAHGSLALARDRYGNEQKLVAEGQQLLLDVIYERWKSGEYAPLFVSEGTTAQKLSSIRRSRYLSVVYDDVLPDLGPNVVVYGLGFHDNDQHLLLALRRGNVQRIAVSVFTGVEEALQQSYCHRVAALLRETFGQSVEIRFFDASSPGCWNNP